MSKQWEQKSIGGRGGEGEQGRGKRHGDRAWARQQQEGEHHLVELEPVNEHLVEVARGSEVIIVVLHASVEGAAQGLKK